MEASRSVPVETQPPGLMRRLAGWAAESFLFRRGKALLEQNRSNWNLPMSKAGKLQAGGYLILRDYADGHFPPQFPDRGAAYQAEIDYATTLPGTNQQEVNVSSLRKPFWFGGVMRTYLHDFVRICEGLERCGVTPPARVLELGCGYGWMAEFLAAAGFDVTGTTIAGEDVVWARKRIASLECKEQQPRLRYEISPMEEVDRRVGPAGSYDAVFVYAALHHAFSWRESIQAASACLKPGGWLLICCEPNRLHTFTSYRVARLSNTHEIGLSRGELIQQMEKCGLSEIVNAGPRWHFWYRPHWLFGRKKGAA